MTCHFNSSAQILLFLLLFPHAYFSNRNNGITDRHNSNLIFSSSCAFPSFPYLILEAQKMVVLNPSICSTLLRATATSEFPSPSEKSHFPTPASFSSHSNDFFLSQRKKHPIVSLSHQSIFLLFCCSLIALNYCVKFLYAFPDGSYLLHSKCANRTLKISYHLQLYGPQEMGSFFILPDMPTVFHV